LALLLVHKDLFAVLKDQKPTSSIKQIIRPCHKQGNQSSPPNSISEKEILQTTTTTTTTT
jgi:hypothetical protein